MEVSVMLVLSRQPGQKIVFPGLGISIEVLRSNGSVTKLGIEAPLDVQIMREELLDRTPTLENSSSLIAITPGERFRQHELNNKLNELTLKLQLLQRQLELGRATDSDGRLTTVLSELNDLERTTPDQRLPLNSLQVLIVEDQANERELLADCLRLSGVRVTTAGNGREAFDYLHDHEIPDLVLLDMHMPELDGPSLMKLIRDDIRLHNLRVFGVSGSTRDEFSSTLPVDGWFSKPIRMDALLEVMKVPRSVVSFSA